MPQVFATRNRLILTSAALLICWIMLMPLFYPSDEQAHFSQVQNYAEFNLPTYPNPDLSKEIYEAERLLGTRFENGTNQFKQDPNFKITYTQSYVGLHEPYLANLPQSNRSAFVAKETPYYPPVYYLLGAGMYRLNYQGSLFDRVFSVRLLNLFFLAGTLFVLYAQARQFWPKNQFFALTVVAFLAFQPMFLYVMSGVNNDGLLIFLSSLSLLLTVRLLQTPHQPKLWLLLAVILTVAIFTKQLILLLLPSLCLTLGLKLIRRRPPTKWLILGIGGVGLVGLITFLLMRQFSWLPYGYSPTILSPETFPVFIRLVFDRLKEMYFSVFVWYWGAFRWLHLTLPPLTYTSIKVVLGLSLAGWFKLFLQAKKHQPLSRETLWQLGLYVAANILFTLLLISWDAMLSLMSGNHHGLQGRYFYPLITSHSLLIVFGLFHIIPKKIQTYLPLIFTSFFTTLNMIALFTNLNSLYTLDTFAHAVRQVSQYKPLFAKWPYLLFYAVFYVTGLLLLIKSLLTLPTTARHRS